MLKSVVSGKRKLFGAELGTIGNQPNQPNAGGQEAGPAREVMASAAVIDLNSEEEEEEEEEGVVFSSQEVRHPSIPDEMAPEQEQQGQAAAAEAAQQVLYASTSSVNQNHVRAVQ